MKNQSNRANDTNLNRISIGTKETYKKCLAHEVVILSSVIAHQRPCAKHPRAFSKMLSAITVAFTRVYIAALSIPSIFTSHAYARVRARTHASRGRTRAGAKQQGAQWENAWYAWRKAISLYKFSTYCAKHIFKCLAQPVLYAKGRTKWRRDYLTLTNVRKSPHTKNRRVLPPVFSSSVRREQPKWVTQFLSGVSFLWAANFAIPGQPLKRNAIAVHPDAPIQPAASNCAWRGLMRVENLREWSW